MSEDWRERALAAEQALSEVRDALETAKSLMMAAGQWTNPAGYTTDAALWIERALSTLYEKVKGGLPELPCGAGPSDLAAGLDAEPSTAWRSMASAPRDGRRILVILKDPIPNTRPDLRNWDGRSFVAVPDGAGDKWRFAAPVGHGGFPSGWMAGWAFLPTSSASQSAEGVQASSAQDEPPSLNQTSTGEGEA